MKVFNYGVKKELLDRYDVTELLEKNHLTVQQIVGILNFNLYELKVIEYLEKK